MRILANDNDDRMIDLSFEDRQYRMVDLYAPDLSTRQMGYLRIVSEILREISLQGSEGDRSKSLTHDRMGKMQVQYSNFLPRMK